jgi:hypothetical protein
MTDLNTLSVSETPSVSFGFRRGSWVKVRRLEDILGTLDADGNLDGVPFMPEMIPFCGRTFRVHRRAERTCVEGVGNRRMERTVFLETVRCNASNHDGCQRRCLLFWKEAWLVPADRDVEDNGAESLPIVEKPYLPTTKDDRFYCQSTELAGATYELKSRNISCYLHDLMEGETTFRRTAYIVWLAIVNRLWRLVAARRYFERPTGEQKRTTSLTLDLKSGELVEVKSLAEIKRTLDATGRNRGMCFESEMGLHCGKRYRVLAPIRKMISEETGKMVVLSNTVLLDGLTCEGICAWNCPRANYFFWRECWLKRVEESPATG